MFTLVLMMNVITMKPALAAAAAATDSNASLSESQFLTLFLKEFAAEELATMPTDGTYTKAIKEYHLAKRLGLPVIGTSYTPFGDDKITRKKAAQIMAQGFTGKLYTEKESVDWLYTQFFAKNSYFKYEDFAPNDFLTKEDAQLYINLLKNFGHIKLVKTPNKKVGQYRVDSFSTPVASYTTYEQAYNHAKKYSYTKVVDTANGMVLWYPPTNPKILFHLYVEGKRVAGFDTKENAIAYANKLENYQSRIMEGNRNISVWENYNHYVVKNGAGKTVPFKTWDEASQYALDNDRQRSYIQSIDDDVNKYKNAFQTKDSANIGNGVLIYNGYEIDRKNQDSYELGTHGIFPQDFFNPYIAYKKNGEYVDSFFDTFIILGRFYSDTGRFEETVMNQANYQEWNWYKERTLQPGGVIDSLNLDVSSIPVVDKIKVYIGIPYPKARGEIIKLDGTSVAADYDNRFELVKWYVNDIAEVFESGKFDNIQFEGFYWINETVRSKDDERLVTETANLIHSKQKKFIFSPHSKATNYKNWSQYGFDAAYFQPNARSVTDPLELKKRLHWGYTNAYQYGMGVNLEMEDISFSSIDSLKRSFDQYMEIGDRYGIQKSSTIMYQGTVMIHRLGDGNTPKFEEQYRDYYDRVYQFLKK